MASYCLTTSVASGQGSITQIAGCDGDPKGPNETAETCASDYPEGSSVQLTALAVIAEGWVVEDWEMSLSADPFTIVNHFTTSTAGATAVSMTMPSYDVDVAVTFSHPDVNLILKVAGAVGGTINLVSPSGIAYDNTSYSDQVNMLLPATSVTIGAESLGEYQISSWTIDGVDQGTVLSQISTNLAEAATSVTVIVTFIVSGDCDTNILDITIVGNGSVNPPSGDYCEDYILNLQPIPAFGHFFKGWSYDILSGITESGITLIVPMSSDRIVTAIFEVLPSFEDADSSLFYCPSTTDKNNVVSFDFINEAGNPSNYDQFHFRVSFYSDPGLLRLLYSASSLSDVKRWFYNDTAYEPFSTDGVSIEEYGTMNIVYDPEILPQEITETQSEKALNSSTYETPLICGVKYYVKIEYYNPFSETFSFVKTISLILGCDSVGSNYWSRNEYDNNWLCSGQGKTDLQVSSSSHSQSIFSDVASNIYGFFQIVWQTRRDGKYQIYGGIWDSDSDYLYSSGQGGYDKLKLVAGYNPIVITDQNESFFIAGHATEGEVGGDITNDIYINACPLPVIDISAPEETDTSVFAKICSPGITNYLSSSYDQIKMRVRKEDISGSLVINADKAVPIINKKSIKLDVDGIHGAYAVRLRNINDLEWGGWINIDNNLYYAGDGATNAEDDFITPDDTSYNAYRIDNSRFIVPWDIDRNNGLKRVCCQVLTMYGITNTLCLDLFVNFDVPRHVFEFYTDEEMGIPFPTHNGQYVLSLKDETGNIITTGDSSTVYFKVIFSETIYKNESTLSPYVDGDLTFNVIQQGINDIYGDTVSHPLDTTDSKTFSGKFVISKEDGIFNKDGNSFIEIVFPEATTTSGCLSDESDKYNLMITDSQAEENKDLTPEEVYNKIQTDEVGKAFEPNQFKQYYDQDDNNFKFGNPGYFRE
jgi:hypothetical protein